MTKKQLVIDTKNTIWHRTHIEISAETEQELQEKINNFNESCEEIMNMIKNHKDTSTKTEENEEA